MRFLLIHNEYGAASGEESQFRQIARLLQDHGHEVDLHVRSSTEIADMRLGKINAFWSGIYSPGSRRTIRRCILTARPDIAFVQNLYPLISPAILPVLTSAGVRVVMRVANYRLMCPNGLHLSHGQVCERCLEGREYWCFLQNCERSFPKSAGYALRGAVARLLGWYRKNVTAYICATQFLKDRLVAEGFEEERIHVVPNVVYDAESAPSSADAGSYVGYVGRISHEKGIPVILRAAELCPNMPFRLAGSLRPNFRIPADLPRNVEFVGPRYGDALRAFYAGSRFTITASECFETFGMSIAESMLYRRPVVAPRHGVFPEFVRDNVTGLLFESGDATGMAAKISWLWNNPQLCAVMGQAARCDVLARSNPESYYTGFMKVCQRVMFSI